MSATAIITVTAVAFGGYFTDGSVGLPKLLSTLLQTVPAQHSSSTSLRLQEALLERPPYAVPARTWLLASTGSHTLAPGPAPALKALGRH